ncbi:DUF2591 family protein [Xenorhabdus sp. Flor]|uniref:phage protein NinX family protein n=1 Tax=Xenorhabdus cabanillasii TaxID=351673 RepID=UPI0019B5224F|nr:phage protein NinX family protein [Xenorhabdus sp. Flor]MBD2816513.1 DUF2591 family protein [Xenorhabdus sp. Flor]
MKLKTSELTGWALDWAVCLAIGGTVKSGIIEAPNHDYFVTNIGKYTFTPSTDWALCGQLIERYSIELVNELLDCVFIWSANCNYVSDDYLDGQTPQIAICRAVVAVQLGDEVEIPDELVEGE